MSSIISGKLGPWEIEWLSIPRGLSGESKVRVNNQIYSVSWRKDREGIWVEFPHGVFGFDLIAEKDDEGRVLYRIKSRTSYEHAVGLHFTRAGEAPSVESSSGKKKAVRVRAQMPGKIVKLLVKAGQSVDKDQILLVMEAMKMENPIKAPQAGLVSKISISEGQAVETGADLLQLGD